MQTLVRTASSAAIVLLAAVLAAVVVGSLDEAWIICVAAVCAATAAVTLLLDRRHRGRMRQRDAAVAHRQKLNKLQERARFEETVARQIEEAQMAAIEQFRRTPPTS